MPDLTISEIYNSTNITRRAIQGYETAGLVAATGKNEKGGLLYDEKAQERIKLIKLFQCLGFSIREIQGLMAMPEEKFKRKVENKLEELREKRTEIDLLLAKGNELIDGFSDIFLRED